MESLTYEFARIGDSTTTVCEAFLPNGFSVGSGKSACVDPSNFDYEMGCKIAKANASEEARNTIWQLEGYLLKVTGKTSEDWDLVNDINKSYEKLDSGDAEFVSHETAKIIMEKRISEVKKESTNI